MMRSVCPTCGAATVNSHGRQDRKITVRVTAPMTATLARAARRRRIPVSQLVRACLEQLFRVEEE